MTFPHPALAGRGERSCAYPDYSAADGTAWQNQVSTIGADAARRLDDPVLPERLDHGAQGPEVTVQRPVGLRRIARVGDQLPAAAPQLTSIPRIRSERPAFDLNHPGGRRAGGRRSRRTPDAPVVDAADGEVK